ncbi:MAG: aspartate kinase [Negativicutes bacterium]|nr:aspartate kinase [Negativicutes bacterium]
MNDLRIIKIGGSFCRHDNIQALHRLGAVISQLSREHPLAIVPGGGPFADTVRKYGKSLPLADATCHFMALLAMDQFAHVIHQALPDSRLIELSDQETRQSIRSCAPAILLGSRFLSQVDPAILPHSWDVTSDSIAAYLAGLLGASMLILIKSVDIDPAVKEPDVDPCFRQTIPPHLPVWILNGHHPERLTELMTTGHTQGIFLPPQSQHQR